MPSDTQGFSGNDIVSYVQSYIGNTSSDFTSFVQLTIPLAESRFCKMHNWSFLFKEALPLTVATGTNSYTLSSSTIGYYMSASDIKQIFSEHNGIVLKKVTLDQLRRMDPEVDDGNSSAYITHWAPAGDNQIVVYPPNFKDTQLFVDGKIRPAALSVMTNYPTIPYHYQESFIQYLVALALDRENDDRASSAKQSSLLLIKADIANDLDNIGDTTEPRIRSQQEQYLDGISTNLDALYNQWVWQQSE